MRAVPGLLPKKLRQKMARYGDEFLTACQRKNTYDCWQDAEDAALTLHDDTLAGRTVEHRFPKKGALLAYNCPDCGLWHIAHFPHRWLRSMWAKAGLPTGSELTSFYRAVGAPANRYGSLSDEERRHLFVEVLA